MLGNFLSEKVSFIFIHILVPKSISLELFSFYYTNTQILMAILLAFILSLLVPKTPFKFCLVKGSFFTLDIKEKCEKLEIKVFILWQVATIGFYVH